MKRAACLLGFGALITIVSCSHIELEGLPCPCSDGYTCCAAANACVGPDSVCPRAPTTPAAVARACGSPHGPALAKPHTAAAFATMLSRQWFICGYDPSSVSVLVAHEGIEFHADGTYVFLKTNADATGFDTMTGTNDHGTYRIHNDLDDGFVAPTDTRRGVNLYMQETDYKGPLDLFDWDWEERPLRFRTKNGIYLWFVAVDDDGSSLVGMEGTDCDPAHSICKSPCVCASEFNSETCTAPAVVGAGEGCYPKTMVRTCLPGLTCGTDTRCH